MLYGVEYCIIFYGFGFRYEQHDNTTFQASFFFLLLLFPQRDSLGCLLIVLVDNQVDSTLLSRQGNHDVKDSLLYCTVVPSKGRVVSMVACIRCATTME